MREDRTNDLPRSFGKYTLLKLLASGGMGAVYLAVSGSEGLEKLLAVKVVLPDLAGVEFIRRFRDEAKVVVRLSHGNLVQVFDAGEVHGEAYLAMEFVEGSDLRTIWNRCVEKRVAFPMEVVVQIIKDSLRGLSYAHRYEGLNLIHRDISPPNIMVTKFGEAKITDFGLAMSSIKIEKTAPGLVFGKIPYMSPEQARGAKLDGRADLYPLGVILWELLTGRRLFPPSGNTNKDLADRAKGPNIPPPSSVCSRVPQELDAVVVKALQPEPGDRYGNSWEMLRHLAEVQAVFWPGMDTDRVAAFMQTLFGEEFSKNKTHREALLEKMRKSGSFTAGGEPLLSAQNQQEKVGKASSTEETQKKSEDKQLLGDRYRLGRMLGEGGMGQVFEAEHTDIGKRVAIKILHKAYSTTGETLERFKREARATTTINHPSIVDVLDFGVTDDGRCYYVMELLEGLSLGDLMEISPQIEEIRAIDIVFNICEAIEAAHRAGVVHRDLKPDNVMLLGEGSSSTNIKVLDFGIARNMGDEFSKGRLTSPGTTLGTPEYMAPEQAAGEPVDQRADVYATCQILYKMLTGKTPHTGASPQEVLIRKLQHPAQDISQHRPDLPISLCEVIMAGLETDPPKRPQSAHQLGVMLKRVRNEMLKPAATSSPPKPGSDALLSPSTGARKKAWIAWLASGAIVGLIILFIVWHFLLGASPEEKIDSEKELSAIATESRTEDDLVSKARTYGEPGDSVEEERYRDNGSDTPDKAAHSVDEKHSSLTAKLVSSPTKADSNTTPDKSAEPEQKISAVSTLSSKEIATKKPKERLSKQTPAPVKEPESMAKPDEKPADPRPAKTRQSPADHIAKGRRLMAQGDFSGAQKSFTQARNLPGGRAAGLTALADLSFQRGDHRNAARLAADAVKAGGGNQARMILGNAYFRLGLYRSAINTYQEILSRNPKHRAARQHIEAARRKLGIK